MPEVDGLLEFISSELKRIEPAAEIEHLAARSSFSDLNLESVHIIELIAAVETHYNVTLPDEELGQVDTVDDLLALVSRATTATG